MSTTPEPPTGLTLNMANNQVILSWSAPTNTGGSAITGYTIQYKLADQTDWIDYVDNTTGLKTVSVTNVTITRLITGSYNFRVYASNSLGKSSPPATITGENISSVPVAPKNFVGIASNSAIDLSWESQEGYKYTVQYKPSYATIWTILKPDKANIKITGLANGTEYNFELWASLNGLDGIPASLSKVIITKPNAPRNLTVSTDITNPTQVVLTWEEPANTGGVQKPVYTWNIQYKLKNNNSEWTTLTSNVTKSEVTVGLAGKVEIYSIGITGLEEKQSYWFRVSAITSQGSGTFIESQLVELPGLADAPANLIATHSDKQVTLKWEPPTYTGGKEIIGYVCWINTQTNNIWVPYSDQVNTQTIALNISCTIITGTTFTIENLTNDIEYSFKVCALTMDGLGTESNLVKATPKQIIQTQNNWEINNLLANPSNLIVTRGKESVVLSWTQPNSNTNQPTGYLIEKTEDAGTSWTIADNITNIPPDVFTCTINNLKSSTAYKFKLSATYTNNEISPGVISDYVFVATVPSAPTSMFGAPGPNSVSIKWTEPMNNGGLEITGYVINYKGLDDTWYNPDGTKATTTNMQQVGTLGSYTITGLTSGQRYRFRICAVNLVGPGSYFEPNNSYIPQYQIVADGKNIYLKTSEGAVKSIQYSQNNIDWADVPGWPFVVKSSDETITNNNRLIVQLTSDLVLPSLSFGEGYIGIGQENITIDGNGYKVDISNQVSHFGFVQNGYGPTETRLSEKNINGYSNVTIRNIGIIYTSKSTFSTEPIFDDGGYVCQPYWAQGASNNLVEKCWCNVASARQFVGGIVGSYAGSNGGNLTVTNCYYTGLIKASCGGIFGQRAGANGGTINVSNCYSTCKLSASNDNYDNGRDAGGIFAKEPGFTNGTVVVSNCYFNGPDTGVYPNILGTVDVSSQIIITNIYGYNDTWSNTGANGKLVMSNNTWIVPIVSGVSNVPYLLGAFGQSGYTSENMSRPVITKILPRQGTGNQTISIVGYGFYACNSVKVGSDYITNVIVTSNTLVEITLGAINQNKNIQLICANGTSNIFQYFWNDNNDGDILSITNINGNQINSSYKPINVTSASQIIIGGNLSGVDTTRGVTVFWYNNDGKEDSYSVSTTKNSTTGNLSWNMPDLTQVGLISLRVSDGNETFVLQDCMVFTPGNPKIISVMGLDGNSFSSLKGQGKFLIYGTNFYRIEKVEINNKMCEFATTTFRSINIILPSSQNPGAATIVLYKNNQSFKFDYMTNSTGAKTVPFLTYVGEPSISDIKPYVSAGDLTARYKITGTNLINPITYSVNGTIGSYWTPLSTGTTGTEILINLPGSTGLSGPAKAFLQLTAFGGSISTEFNVIETALTKPSLTLVNPSVAPTSGINSNGSVIVNLSGSGFSKSTKIKIKQVPVSASSFVIQNSNLISLTLPGVLSAPGDAPIYIGTPGGEMEWGGKLAYVNPPTITSITPSKFGSGGIPGKITIKGTDFSNQIAPIVKINNIVQEKITFVNSTTIEISTPTVFNQANPIGFGYKTIELETYTGTVKNSKLFECVDIGLPIIAGLFKFNYPDPTKFEQLTYAKVSEGNADGPEILITGSNFIGSNDNPLIVKVNGKPASIYNYGVQGVITSSNSDNLYVKFPNSSVSGNAQIEISGIGGTITNSTIFKYVGPPNVTSISPSVSYVAGGNILTINGSGFTGKPDADLTVKFRNQVAKIKSVIADTVIYVEIPETTMSGRADITITNVTASTTITTFAYAGIPTITDIQPRLLKVTGNKQSPNISISNYYASINFSTETFDLPTVLGAGSGTISWRAIPEGIINIDVAKKSFSLLKIGTVQLHATVSETTEYSEQTTYITMNINKAPRTLSNFRDETGKDIESLTIFVANNGYLIGLPDLTPKSGTIRYSWTNPEVASFVFNLTENVGTIQIYKAGKVTLTATVEKDENYGQVSKSIDITIGKSPSKINSFTIPEVNFMPWPYTYNEYTKPTVVEGNGIIEYSSANPAIATIDKLSGAITMITSAGVYITATVKSTDQYESTSTQAYLKINKTQGLLSDWVSFGPIDFAPIKFYPSLPEKLFINSSYVSDGTISFTSSNTTAAEINQDTGEIAINSPGTTTLTATLNGTSKFLEMTTTISITINKTQGVLSEFPQIENKPYSPNNFIPKLPRKLPSSTGYISDSNEIKYSSSDDTIAQINENTGEIQMINPGTVTITATLSETLKYLGTSVSTTFTIGRAQKQIIWNSVIDSIAYQSEALGVDQIIPNLDSVPSKSSDPTTISYELVNSGGIATISGTNISFLKAGVVNIKATFAQTEKYFSVSDTISFTVRKASSGLSWPGDQTYIYSQTSGQTLSFTRETGDNNFGYSISNNQIFTCDMTSSPLDSPCVFSIKPLKAGTANLTVYLIENERYLPAQQTITITITKATGTIENFTIGTNGQVTYTPDFYSPSIPNVIGNGVKFYTLANPEHSEYVVIRDTAYCLLELKKSTPPGVKIRINMSLQESDQYTGSTAFAEFTIAKAPSAFVGNDLSQIFKISTKYFSRQGFSLIDNGITDIIPKIARGDGSIQYSSLDTNIATTNGPFIQTINTGKVLIKATITETDRYTSISCKTLLEIIKQNAEISTFTIADKTYGDEPFIPNAFVPNNSGKLLIVTKGNGIPQFTCADTTIASIENNGRITIHTSGITSITITVPATEEYYEVSRTVNFKVEPKITTSEKWEIGNLINRLPIDFNKLDIGQLDGRTIEYLINNSTDGYGVAQLYFNTGKLTAKKLNKEASITAIVNATDKYTGFTKTAYFKIVENPIDGQGVLTKFPVISNMQYTSLPFDFTKPIFISNEVQGNPEILYSVSGKDANNNDIAEINNTSQIKLKGLGTVTINANVPVNEQKQIFMESTCSTSFTINKQEHPIRWVNENSFQMYFQFKKSDGTELNEKIYNLPTITNLVGANINYLINIPSLEAVTANVENNQIKLIRNFSKFQAGFYTGTLSAEVIGTDLYDSKKIVKTITLDLTMNKQSSGLVWTDSGSKTSSTPFEMDFDYQTTNWRGQTVIVWDEIYNLPSINKLGDGKVTFSLNIPSIKEIEFTIDNEDCTVLAHRTLLVKAQKLFGTLTVTISETENFRSESISKTAIFNGYF